MRAARAKEISRKGYTSYRARHRAVDEVAYKRKVTSDKLVWSEKNKDKVLKTAAKVRNKAIAAKRFHCTDCNMSLQSQAALDAHLITQAHLDQVAGVKRTSSNLKALEQTNARRHAQKAEKLFKCEICDKAYPDDWSLRRHLAGPMHIKRATKAAKIAEGN